MSMSRLGRSTSKEKKPKSNELCLDPKREKSLKN
jgi:hypothetical protein